MRGVRGAGSTLPISACGQSQNTVKLGEAGRQKLGGARRDHRQHMQVAPPTLPPAPAVCTHLTSTFLLKASGREAERRS